MDKTQGFGHYLDRTVKTIQIAYQKAFKTQEVNLTIEQWVFLQQIYERGEFVSQRELTDLNFRTRATTSRMIKKLLEKGYIIRSHFEGDKKQNKLSLSLIGQKTVKKLLPFIHHLRSVGYRDIKEDDFKIFLNVLDKIWSNYQQFEVLPPQYKNADEPRN